MSDSHFSPKQTSPKLLLPAGVKPYYFDERAGIAVIHGDCREILPMLERESVDMIWTDPPYGHNNNNGDLIHHWEEALGRPRDGGSSPRPIANDGPEANDLVRWAFGEFGRVLRPGSCCCCCCGGGGPDPQFARWSLWLDEAVGFKQMIVWDKGGLGMGWHYRRNYETVLIGEKPGAACKWYGGHDVANVIRVTGIKPNSDDHPTPKPIELVTFFLRLHSQRGDLVLDPFMGAGTSAEACKLEGRRYVGIEIEKRWCEAAVRRLAQEVLPYEKT